MTDPIDLDAIRALAQHAKPYGPTAVAPQAILDLCEAYEEASITGDRYREHSIMANTTLGRILVALGRVQPGDTEADGDLLADLDLLIEDRDDLRRRLQSLAENIVAVEQREHAALVHGVSALTVLRDARSRHMTSSDPTECMVCDHDHRVMSGTQGPLCQEAQSLDAAIAVLSEGGNVR